MVNLRSKRGGCGKIVLVKDGTSFLGPVRAPSCRFLALPGALLFSRDGMHDRYILHPDAHPPTLYSVALIAYMPSLQRERADFIERLVQFLAQPAPKKAFVIMVGKKGLKPTTQILGDPIQNDSAGRPKDLPVALHWIELLARLDALEGSTSAQRALARFLKDCDEDGVWNAKGLRAFPKSPSGLAGFAFPLEISDKTAESRRVDVTFRLAHIAKLAGLDLEYV